MIGLHTVAERRDNNFNLFRMLAATAVLISHAYALSLGSATAEPFVTTLDISMGGLAVMSFFAISGFFISQSFDRKRSLMDFCVARILRIYPGLLLVLLLTVFVLGPALTTSSITKYFSDPGTFTYVPRNLSLKFLQYDLPGVFQNNPYSSAINGSLWTLFYEVACYGLVAVVGILGLTTRSFSFVVLLVIYCLGYISVKEAGQSVLQSHSTALL